MARNVDITKTETQELLSHNLLPEMAEVVIAPEIQKKEEADPEKKPTYPLIRFTDFADDIKLEVIDLISGALEKHISDIEITCKVIKEDMDRLYGEAWQIVVGENFGFDVTYQTKHVLYMFINGNLGILIWKCS